MLSFQQCSTDIISQSKAVKLNAKPSLDHHGKSSTAGRRKQHFGVLIHFLFMLWPYRLFLVIEYVKGGDLMFHMQRQRKLPEEHAR